MKGTVMHGQVASDASAGHAVPLDLFDRAAVKAAGDQRRSHHAGGMGDVKLVRHEGA